MSSLAGQQYSQAQQPPEPVSPLGSQSGSATHSDSEKAQVSDMSSDGQPSPGRTQVRPQTPLDWPLRPGALANTIPARQPPPTIPSNAVSPFTELPESVYPDNSMAFGLSGQGDQLLDNLQQWQTSHLQASAEDQYHQRSGPEQGLSPEAPPMLRRPSSFEIMGCGPELESGPETPSRPPRHGAIRWDGSLPNAPASHERRRPLTPYPSQEGLQQDNDRARSGGSTAAPYATNPQPRDLDGGQDMRGSSQAQVGRHRPAIEWANACILTIIFIAALLLGFSVVAFVAVVSLMTTTSIDSLGANPNNVAWCIMSIVLFICSSAVLLCILCGPKRLVLCAVTLAYTGQRRRQARPAEPKEIELDDMGRNRAVGVEGVGVVVGSERPETPLRGQMTAQEDVSPLHDSLLGRFPLPPSFASQPIGGAAGASDDRDLGSASRRGEPMPSPMGQSRARYTGALPSQLPGQELMPRSQNTSAHDWAAASQEHLLRHAASGLSSAPTETNTSVQSELHPMPRMYSPGGAGHEFDSRIMTRGGSSAVAPDALPTTSADPSTTAKGKAREN